MEFPVKNIVCAILGCFLCYLLQAQNLQNNSKKNPFSITGSINTSASFYSSNEGDSAKTRPGYAWNVYGSFKPKVNQFSFPLSFVVTDYSNNHKSPYVQFGISPTYKWAKLHFGTRSMRFSPLIFDGLSFTGAGLELSPKWIRFAAFYGRLNKAVGQDTALGNYPRYSRKAYGFKLGIGNTSNYIDLIYFHAKDDSNSVKLIKNSAINDSLANSISAQENAVLGSSFKLTFYKKLFFTGDVAVSGLTKNLAADSLNLDSAYQYQKLTNFVSKFMTVNSSSFASFAGQSSLAYYSPFFNASFNYRRVQPGFNSLGTPYTMNDIELFSFLNSFSIAKGRLNINSGISSQHNNLDKNLNNEAQTLTGNIGLNAMLGQHLNFNLSYFGTGLKEKAGAQPVQDSSFIKQDIAQFNAGSSYNLTKENKIHSITGNLNYSSLSSKYFLAAPPTKSDNLSASLAYTLGLIRQSRNFSVAGLYNYYKQDTSAYKSYGITISPAVALLKEKNLNLQGSIGYFLNSYISNGATRYNNNMSYSFNAGYTAKRHTFNFFINYLYTPPKMVNDIVNKTYQYAVAFKSFTGNISYNYRF